MFLSLLLTISSSTMTCILRSFEEGIKSKGSIQTSIFTASRRIDTLKPSWVMLFLVRAVSYLLNIAVFWTRYHTDRPFTECCRLLNAAVRGVYLWCMTVGWAQSQVLVPDTEAWHVAQQCKGFSKLWGPHLLPVHHLQDITGLMCLTRKAVQV